ncbi:DsbA family oxidoreductase [Streptomyces sp. NPDC049881]|uniref:DsbA family oxidoreductase n=1 Tax=Streptomyces sp. NPDC049881 TaxID=3155778 RepID=UPI0034131ACB
MRPGGSPSTLSTVSLTGVCSGPQGRREACGVCHGEVGVCGLGLESYVGVVGLPSGVDLPRVSFLPTVGRVTKISVEVWSDLICPWCYIGKRRLAGALERFEWRDAVRVRWRSYELDPATPGGVDETIAQRMLRRQGIPPERAAQLLAHVSRAAADEGLEYDLERARPVNTLDAHRLLHLAADHGLADAVQERLMRAYTREGALLSDHATLVRLAGEAGLAEDAARALLASDDRTREVREDEARAAELGLSGVPSFVVDGRYAVSGAESADSLLALLRRAVAA